MFYSAGMGISAWSESSFEWAVITLSFNRRSATLRSYAGDTSLPGGRVDPGDRTFEDTAVSS